jgi:glycosyltransferase involved in cell wall biosynthesis
VRWDAKVEATALQEMSVGIMPLPDNEWTRGKCSFKMLQYMAAGVPAVVSPVGMNKEVLSKGQVGFAVTTDKQWYEALETLYKDKKLQLNMGNTARKVVEEYFSAQKVADSLAGIFKDLVKGK